MNETLLGAKEIMDYSACELPFADRSQFSRETTVGIRIAKGITMSGDELSKYLTPAQLAEKLQITTKKLFVMRQNGDGPMYCKLGNRTIRYALKDVENWLNQRRFRSIDESESC